MLKEPKQREEKKAKSREPKRKKSYDENLELVKNQCGRHSVSSMALILNMTSQTIRDRIKKGWYHIYQKGYGMPTLRCEKKHC